MTKLQEISDNYSTVTFTDARGVSATYRIQGNQFFLFDDAVASLQKSGIPIMSNPIVQDGDNAKEILKALNYWDKDYSLDF